MKANVVLRWLLAWSLMCCTRKPPLYPTTTGILLLTAVRGECTFGYYLRKMNCVDGTVRVQVHRLHRVGLLDVNVERIGGRRRKVYSLTSAGRSMVYAWVRQTSEEYRDL